MNAELNEKNTGICPFPDQSVLQIYVDSLKVALEKSQCHSEDWLDWLAQKECGIGAIKDTKPTWDKLVDSAFNITHWPAIHAGDNYKCLQDVMQQSRVNLEKSQAVIKAAFMLGISALTLALLL